jgi:hypothetical protein
MKLSRYWRALVGAARMTIRGEAVPPRGSASAVARRYPQTAAWLAETVVLVESAWSAAKGVDLNAVKARVDRREMSLATILNGVRFHAEQEYPHMLTHEPTYAFLAIQGANLNDQRAMKQFLAAELPSSLRLTLEKLAAHLAKFTPEIGEV